MIEQAVEKRVMDVLAAAVGAAGVEGVSVHGAWQVADEGEAKAVETAAERGMLSVKVAPREYATPTVPHATLSATVALDLRAEADGRGAARLAVAEAVSRVLVAWQDSFAAFALAFAGIDGFTPCGFRLGGGDVGLDRNLSTWTYSQSFTINCIIKKGTDA